MLMSFCILCNFPSSYLRNYDGNTLLKLCFDKVKVIILAVCITLLFWLLLHIGYWLHLLSERTESEASLLKVNIANFWKKICDSFVPRVKNSIAFSLHETCGITFVAALSIKVLLRTTLITFSFCSVDYAFQIAVVHGLLLSPGESNLN